MLYIFRIMVTSVTTLSVIWLGLVDQAWVLGILSGECCFFCKVLNFIMTWDWIISSAFADHQHVLLVLHVLMIFLIYLISNIVLFKIWCCLFSVIWSTWAWMALMVIHVSVPVLDTWLPGYWLVRVVLNPVLGGLCTVWPRPEIPLLWSCLPT